MRPYVILFIKGVLCVSLAFLMTVLVGLYKESREENASLRARIASVSAMIPVSLPSDSVSDSVPGGDPYLLAAEVLSIEELPGKGAGDPFRYLVVETPDGDGQFKRVSFKMKKELVVDFLKRSVGCAIFR